VVSLLYIFAGKARQSDVGGQLKTYAEAGLIKLHVLEVDLLRAPEHNVSNEVFWASLLKRVRAKEFRVVIATPPCGTFSRARHANKAGPPPIRSRLYPFGYPWLFGRHKHDAEQANEFVRQTFEICVEAFTVGSGFLFEHPEDLGKTQDGQSPASIFNLPDFFKLMSLTRALTIAFHQCPWGAESSKPTRMVLTLDAEDPRCQNKLYQGLPKFSKAGVYLGPLPRHCIHRASHKPLLGKHRASHKPLRTRRSRQWKHHDNPHKPLLGRDKITGAFKTSAAAS
jgi:hypothetical protein